MANERLITKVYFPRLVVPIAAVLGGMVDFAIAFVILLMMMLYYGIVPTWAIVTLPGFILLAIMTALGVGLWLSALNVQYRDVRYTIGFLIQFWLFATPVAYPSSIVPERWLPLYGLNPMAGVVEGFRWACWGNQNHRGAAGGFRSGCYPNPRRRTLLLPAMAEFADVVKNFPIAISV